MTQEQRPYNQKSKEKRGEGNMKESLKTKRGITLIALIITIIILLILAMVTINILINQGIIGHANNAVRGYEVAEEKELISLAYQNYKMDKVNKDDAQLTVDGANGGNPIAKEDGTWYITFDKTKHNYELSEDGTVSPAGERWVKDGDTIKKGDYTLKIGDYVDYSSVIPDVTLTQDSQIIKDLKQYSGNTDETKNTPDRIKQEKSFKWRVLDVQKGKIRLISNSETTQARLILKGINGYNNGVYLTNQVCSDLYSSNMGTARNCCLEDIVDKLNYDYTQVLDDDNELSYGTEHEYTKYRKYPNIYAQEEGLKEIDDTANNGTLKVSEQSAPIEGSKTATKKVKVTQTIPGLNTGWNVGSTAYNEKIYWNLFKPSNTYTGEYWLSTRGIICNPEFVNFDMLAFNTTQSTECFTMYYGWGGDNYGENRLRPIVTLNSNVVVTKDADHDGTESKPCILTVE